MSKVNEMHLPFHSANVSNQCGRRGSCIIHYKAAELILTVVCPEGWQGVVAGFTALIA